MKKLRKSGEKEEGPSLFYPVLPTVLPYDSGVSYLSLFLYFINDRSIRNCTSHSNADVSILHHPTSTRRRASSQEWRDPRLEAAERLASDLALISDWDKTNLVSFKVSRIPSRRVARHLHPQLTFFTTLYIIFFFRSSD